MLKPLTEKDHAYWHANVKLIALCLSIWALVSYGFGMLLRPLFMGIKIGGADFGFWFAQQGAIYFFVLLIFIYVVRMNMLDREFNVNEE